MLLVIDVGNTNTVMGVYKGDVLVKDWRIHTQRNTTADEFSVLAGSLLAASAIASTISSLISPIDDFQIVLIPISISLRPIHAPFESRV